MTEGNYSNVGHRGPVYKGLGAMNPCYNLMGEAYTGLWWGILREIDNLGDPGFYGRIILR
jgi:hypothetical protein